MVPNTVLKTNNLQRGNLPTYMRQYAMTAPASTNNGIWRLHYVGVLRMQHERVFFLCPAAAFNSLSSNPAIYQLMPSFMSLQVMVDRWIIGAQAPPDQRDTTQVSLRWVTSMLVVCAAPLPPRKFTPPTTPGLSRFCRPS